MSFLRGGKASVEKLMAAREELLVAEQNLMTLRSTILGQKEDQEHRKQHLQSLETEQQDHLDRAEEQASLINTYNVQIEGLKEQIQTLLGLIQEAEIGEQHHQSESARISDDIANEIKAKQQLEAEIDSKMSIFTQQREELKTVKSAVEKASKADRKKRHRGPSNGKLTLSLNDQQIHTLHALGDVHGWAPGIINYMRTHSLANLSIGGKELGDEEMQSLFPDPMERIAEQRDLPRVGIDNHPGRSQDIHTAFHRIVVEEQHNGTALICLGDLVDRGDHNELVLEIMRQSILQNMGMRWMLLGNHEQMLIEDDFKRWAKNEFNYMAEANKEHAGSFLHQPALTGCDTVEDGLKMNFNILQGALGSALLAQHLALVASLEPASKAMYRGLVKPVFDELKITDTSLEKAMFESNWSMHELGQQFLDGLRTLSDKEAIVVPGAIGLAVFQDQLFVHAEPNGLKDLGKTVTDDLAGIKTTNGLSFALPRLYRGRIMEATYLWARGWKDEATSLRDVLEATAIPSISTVVHGHQAGPGIRTEQSGDNNPVKVIAVDEGMTPYYFYNYGHFSEAYNPLRIPEGYQEVTE